MAGKVIDEQSAPDGTALVEKLLRDCQKLLTELEDFRAFVEQRRILGYRFYKPVEVISLKTAVATELKTLQKLSETDLTADRTIHALNSSNLPYHCAVWESAKGSKSLVALHKRFYWEKRPIPEWKKAATRTGPIKKSEICVVVDVVGSDGEEWTKVSVISEERLKFEIAKAEWEAGESSSSESDGEDENPAETTRSDRRISAREDDLNRIELVRFADALQRAAKANRTRYKHPQVRIVLPRVSLNPPVELHSLLARIRSTGAVVVLGPQPVLSTDLNKDIFPKLLPAPHPPLTDTLNLDCSILLALASDLSHAANHPILPEYKVFIKQQIEFETKEPSLPSVLWPAMAGRNLICTQEAANTMKEIVDALGTSTERKRTELMLADHGIEHDEQKQKNLRAAFAKVSDFPVPDEWRLPIYVVDVAVSDSDIQAAISAGGLPPVAQQIAENLTGINKSVFMHGWMQQISTVTSNRGVARQIENAIEKDDQGAIGPEIWVREPARSLLGKEKERRK